jgi:hypothetical protein
MSPQQGGAGDRRKSARTMGATTRPAERRLARRLEQPRPEVRRDGQRDLERPGSRSAADRAGGEVTAMP